MKNIVVVGTGFSGSIIARKIAEDCNLPVTVVERRDHIAGNMYDEVQKGIIVQKYGPHIICTDHYKIVEMLSKYSPMEKYTVKLLSNIDGNWVRLPFNFQTVQELAGPEKAEVIINKLRKEYVGRDRVPIGELLESKDSDISEYAHLLFEKAYKTYVAKQWDLPADELDISIMGRVPMAMSYDERYMNKDFQYLPVHGFTKMFEEILNHPNITVRTNEDALDHLELNEETKEVFYDGKKVDILVFTGALDELFGVKYGELPYRSLDIKYEWFNQERVFPETIVSFPQAEGYTRKTEYKFLNSESHNDTETVVAAEYPVPYVKGGEIAPYYPVITKETKELHVKYEEEAKKFPSIFYCGRLAEFRYYNMDDCILNALDVFEKIKNVL